MNIYERSRTIELCKNVDRIIMNCPWIINKDFIEKENIDYVICVKGHFIWLKK